MKTKLLLATIILFMGLTGCNSKNDTLPSTPVPSSGTFSGQFKLYHVNPTTKTVRIDSANLNLVMETATGFKVTGDTSTIHAGSYGSYVVSSGAFEILFDDKTLPSGTTTGKIHLSGIYAYHYDGSTLQLAAYGPQDTLQF